MASCPVSSHGEGSSSADGCPVDHKSRDRLSQIHASSPGSAPHSLPPSPHSHGEGSSSSEKCPVDHTSREKWSQIHASQSSSFPSSSSPSTLPTARETSSIPREDGERWVYPSQAQFYDAMARKNHNPQAVDMKVVVPIHNAVNERTWNEVLKWEAGWGGEKCGGIKLVSFKGDASKLSPKARVKMLFGYSAPFDRHDWMVDRCGTKMRYIIDFYSGKQNPAAGGPASFYLDVRPALDSFEGVKMRMGMFWSRWFPSTATPATTSIPQNR